MNDDNDANPSYRFSTQYEVKNVSVIATAGKSEQVVSRCVGLGQGPSSYQNLCVGGGAAHKSGAQTCVSCRAAGMMKQGRQKAVATQYGQEMWFKQ